MALAVGMKAKQDAQKAHLQKFIDRFRAKASKAAQAQSRIKQLEKMQDIAVPLEERTTPFVFDNPVELASPLVVLDEADLGYVEGKPVLKRVSLRLDHDDRIVDHWAERAGQDDVGEVDRGAAGVAERQARGVGQSRDGLFQPGSAR
jgi:ATPase subunit of ABC transporter with duplicated ATPase domains